MSVFLVLSFKTIVISQVYEENEYVVPFTKMELQIWNLIFY